LSRHPRLVIGRSVENNEVRPGPVVPFWPHAGLPRVFFLQPKVIEFGRAPEGICVVRVYPEIDRLRKDSFGDWDRNKKKNHKPQQQRNHARRDTLGPPKDPVEPMERGEHLS